MASGESVDRLISVRTGELRSGLHVQKGLIQPLCRERVSRPVLSSISKRLYRHISQSVCPWNRKFSKELAEDSAFRAREFVADKDSLTLARDILALDQEQFSAAFRKSPMKRAKLAGLRRNAAVALRNADTRVDTAARPSRGIPPQG